jgi:hypothetical protein
MIILKSVGAVLAGLSLSVLPIQQQTLSSKVLECYQRVSLESYRTLQVLDASLAEKLSKKSLRISSSLFGPGNYPFVQRPL